MSRYRINDEDKDFSDLSRQEINDLLRHYHQSKDTKTFCLCTPGKLLPLHVFNSSNNNFFLRKAAHSGDQHDKLCHHHSLTEQQAACMGYTLKAITKSTGSEEDQLLVSLVTPLRKGQSPVAGQDDLATYKFRTGSRPVSSRMTDLGLLHLLWEKAGLHGIGSYKAEKSIWTLVRGAATSIKPRCFKSLERGLSDILLLPLHDESEKQHQWNWAKLNEAHEKGRHVLFAAKLTPEQIKGLNFTAENTHEIDLRSLFGVKVAIYKDRVRSLLDQFNKSFGDELGYSNDGADLIIFGVARPDKFKNNLFARIETMVAMPVAQKHIPFDSSYEWRFVDELVKQRRHFVKPLRYEAEKDHQVFPDFVLTDCNPLHVIEVYGRTDEKYLARKKEKKEIYASEDYPYKCWEWEASTKKDLHTWLANHPLPLACC